MKIRLTTLATLLALAACSRPSDDNDKARGRNEPVASTPAWEGLRFEDAPPSAGAPAPDSQLGLEVTLDRLGFSPGVIDGRATRFDAMALRGFQAANALEETGRLDEPTKAAIARVEVPAVRTVRIPADFAKGPFIRDLPHETAKQARFSFLGYRSLAEALAERFHTTPALLVALNGAGTAIGAGMTLRVPDIADVDTAALGKDERGWNATLVTLGVAPEQPQASRVVVSRSAGTLRAYDAGGKLLAQFPVTTGSEHDPLPIGNWKVLGVSRNPDFHYSPKLFWDVSDSQPDRLLKPGPNGPVGVVWIDLSKEHYGIHGTSEPASIGHSESHGCVRLTNWDAARLAQMVSPGVAVEFET